MCGNSAWQEAGAHRQLFEEMILILEGRAPPRCGTTRRSASPLNGRRALVRIPLNAGTAFQRFGHEAARYVGVTMRRRSSTFSGPRLPFNWTRLKNRFNGDRIISAPKASREAVAADQFVADAINLPLISAKERARGGHIRFHGEGSMNSTSRSSVGLQRAMRTGRAPM